MIKVAGYCRVSTDKEDQVNSFENQQRYFREYIQNHPGWELSKIYADEGITGTSTKKRIQFNQMINDAYEGRFRMIVTKEVSRFSRNILDTIRYTRELRAIGIGVIFSTDQINTLEPEAEMLLSFLASIAQEESRRTSSRVVWGQTRQMEKGVVFGPSLLGYDVKKGKLSINPEGARTVQLIFHKYAVEQISTAEIARYLTQEELRLHTEGMTWRASTVIRILKNEKYVGDLVQKKTYTPDYLTHEKRTNQGKVPLVIIKNHHEPIITREIWNMAQERLLKNNKHREGEAVHSNRFIFSGKIKCGECGRGFVGRIKYLKNGTKTRQWRCGTSVYKGSKECAVGKIIRDDDALQMLKASIKSLQMNFEVIIDQISAMALNAIMVENEMSYRSPQILHQEIERVQRKKEAVMDSYFSQEISKEDMRIMTQKYERRIEELYGLIESAKHTQVHNQDKKELYLEIKNLITAIVNGEVESEVFYKTILYSMTVYHDRHIELRLNHLAHVFRFGE